ncbi:TetR/AcrR family transcriptional regulator [Peptoniphilus mikwangii]|uniref:TetR/AcrR family transcriptional regulator n=1 Tax=Peptoniphilus mikwangii TaxID=1354300 RepID=UPI000404E290|nr:TetR/AcrR family transcriptional regulator [Peptoniphilus mikwangii]
MSNGNYEVTHKKILESAKRLFLKNGYERANLREICRGAEITTGAFYRHFEDKNALFSELVDPAINGIMKKYRIAEGICFDYLSNEDLISMMKFGVDIAMVFIDYIYDNFDAFKLILMCSDGTRYVNFIDWLVEEEMRANKRMFMLFEEHNIVYKKISEKEMHMLVHSYFSCMFETIFHDYEREEAIECIRTITKFYSAGWKELLEISM